MKVLWFALLCVAFAKTEASKQCLQRCLAFAEQLEKAGEAPVLAEETRVFCERSGIDTSSDACKSISSHLSQLMVLLKSRVPKRRVCQRSCKSNFLKIKGKKETFKTSEKSCRICKTVVGYVSLAIKLLNQTEGEITTSVRKMCMTILSKESQIHECLKIVGYVDQVFQLVLQGLEPKDICIQLKFCNSKSKPIFALASAKQETSVTSELENKRDCRLCHIVRDTVYGMAKEVNSSEEVIERTVKIFCSAGKQHMHKSCKDVIALSKHVLMFVKAGTSKFRVCRFNCQSRAEKKAVASEKSCRICKQVVGYISLAVKAFNQTERDIIASVEQICQIIASKETTSSECRKIVGYVNEIFQLVLKGLDTSTICVELKFCTDAWRAVQSELRFSALLKEQGSSMLYNEKKATEKFNELPYFVKRYQKSEMTKVSTTAGCKLCKTATNIVYFSIKYANSTIEAIEEAIKVVCSVQIPPVKKMCLSYLSKIDEVIQYIEKGLMPNDICVKLGFCNKTIDEANRISWQEVQKDYDSTAKSVCGICSTTQKIVRNNMGTFESSLRMMSKYSRLICINPATNDAKEKCSDIEKVLESAKAFKKQMLDPEECKKVICNKPFIIAVHVAKKTNSQVCDICRYAENMLVKKFQDLDKLLKMSLKEVAKLCDLIPIPSLSSKCHLYVNRTEDICDKIVEELKSAKLCEKLGLCPKQIEDQQKKTWKGSSIVKNIFSSKDGNPACSICKVSVRAAQRRYRGATAARRMAAIPCGKLERISGKKICSTLNVETMLGRVSWRESPEKVCKRLRLCEDKIPFVEIVTNIASNIMKIFG